MLGEWQGDSLRACTAPTVDRLPEAAAAHADDVALGIRTLQYIPLQSEVRCARRRAHWLAVDNDGLLCGDREAGSSQYRRSGGARELAQRSATPAAQATAVHPPVRVQAWQCSVSAARLTPGSAVGVAPLHVHAAAAGGARGAGDVAGGGGNADGARGAPRDALQRAQCEHR